MMDHQTYIDGADSPDENPYVIVCLFYGFVGLFDSNDMALLLFSHKQSHLGLNEEQLEKHGISIGVRWEVARLASKHEQVKEKITFENIKSWVGSTTDAITKMRQDLGLKVHKQDPDFAAENSIKVTCKIMSRAMKFSDKSYMFSSIHGMNLIASLRPSRPIRFRAALASTSNCQAGMGGESISWHLSPRAGALLPIGSPLIWNEQKSAHRLASDVDSDRGASYA
jgi:hypothetical protein